MSSDYYASIAGETADRGAQGAGTDLITFLKARLDELEEGAQGVIDGDYSGHPATAEMELRLVAAGRAILAIHVPDEDRDCFACITVRVGYQEQWAWDAWPCQTVRWVASIFSDHPEYRQEWKP